MLNKQSYGNRSGNEREKAKSTPVPPPEQVSRLCPDFFVSYPERLNDPSAAPSQVSTWTRTGDPSLHYAFALFPASLPFSCEFLQMKVWRLYWSPSRRFALTLGRALPQPAGCAKETARGWRGEEGRVTRSYSNHSTGTITWLFFQMANGQSEPGNPGGLLICQHHAAQP